MRRGTTASRVYSYGVANLSNVINSAVGLPVPLPLVAAVVIAGGAMLAGAAIGAAAAADSDGDPDESNDALAMQAQACLIAAAIYVGSYWLRSNYDYRLLFTLPAVPYFNALRRCASAGARRIGLAALTAQFVALSQTLLRTVFGRVGFALNIGGKVALVCAFSAVAAYTVARPAARARVSEASVP